MTTYMTTAEVAAERKVSTTAIRRLRKQLNVGEKWGGRAGYRFSEEDRAVIAEAMKPQAPVQRRRRVRRSA